MNKRFSLNSFINSVLILVLSFMMLTFSIADLAKESLAPHSRGWKSLVDERNRGNDDETAPNESPLLLSPAASLFAIILATGCGVPEIVMRDATECTRIGQSADGALIHFCPASRTVSVTSSWEDTAGVHHFGIVLESGDGGRGRMLLVHAEMATGKVAPKRMGKDRLIQNLEGGEVPVPKTLKTIQVAGQFYHFLLVENSTEDLLFVIPEDEGVPIVKYLLRKGGSFQLETGDFLGGDGIPELVLSSPGAQLDTDASVHLAGGSVVLEGYLDGDGVYRLKTLDNAPFQPFTESSEISGVLMDPSGSGTFTLQRGTTANALVLDLKILWEDGQEGMPENYRLFFDQASKEVTMRFDWRGKSHDLRGPEILVALPQLKADFQILQGDRAFLDQVTKDLQQVETAIQYEITIPRIQYYPPNRTLQSGTDGEEQVFEYTLDTNASQIHYIVLYNPLSHTVRFFGFAGDRLSIANFFGNIGVENATSGLPSLLEQIRMVLDALETDLGSNTQAELDSTRQIYEILQAAYQDAQALSQWIPVGLSQINSKVVVVGMNGTAAASTDTYTYSPEDWLHPVISSSNNIITLVADSALEGLGIPAQAGKGNDSSLVLLSPKPEGGFDTQTILPRSGEEPFSSILSGYYSGQLSVAGFTPTGKVSVVPLDSTGALTQILKLDTQKIPFAQASGAPGSPEISSSFASGVPGENGFYTLSFVNPASGLRPLHFSLHRSLDSAS